MKLTLLSVILAAIPAFSHADVARQSIACTGIVSDSEKVAVLRVHNFEIQPLWEGQYQIVERTESGIAQHLQSHITCAFNSSNLDTNCTAEDYLQAQLTQNGNQFVLKIARGLEAPRVVVSTSCTKRTINTEY